MQTGYVNGSDLLMAFAGSAAGTPAATGHCTNHSTTFSTETKTVAVKPAANVDAGSTALFKNKRITGLSVQVEASGLKFYSEGESGFKVALGAWKAGKSIPVKLFEREHDSTPYCSGNFVITSLKESSPAGEDATYDISLENDGAVTIDETKIDLLALNSGSGGGTGGGTGDDD